MEHGLDDGTIATALQAMAGWRRLGGQLHCRYAGASFAAAVEFAARIGAIALANGCRLDIALRGAEIDVNTTGLLPDAASLAAARAVTANAGAAGMRAVAGDTTAGPAATWVTPGHFYSPIPDRRELLADREQWETNGPRELAGIDLRLPQQMGLARQLARYYGEEDFPEQPRPGHRYNLANEYFPYGDAFAWYALLRHLRPQRVVEVGSGWSSALLLDTDERFLGGHTECTFIEPFPDRLLSLLLPGDLERVRLLRRRVQDVSLDEFRALRAGDVLFVDSSHVCKTGSDVHHLLFTVLPVLASGVWVHFHDVHGNFEYPAEWILEGRAWNESYFLRAFLMHNREWNIELHGATLALHAAHELLPLLPRVGQNVGGSLWLAKA